MWFCGSCCFGVVWIVVWVVYGVVVLLVWLRLVGGFMVALLVARFACCLVVAMLFSVGFYGWCSGWVWFSVFAY